MCQVGLSEIWLQFDGRLRRTLCSVAQSSNVRADHVKITQCVLAREPGPGEREFRVELHGFVKVFDSIEIVALVIAGPKTVG